MTVHTVTVAMNGVTGRMGRNQHLERSIIPIRDEGGVLLPNGDRIVPVPVLLGRNEDKLRDLAETYEVDRWSTSLEDVLADPAVDVYFDAQLTNLRAAAVRKAITAGKAIYCEKPLAEDGATALELARLAQEAGIKHGIVQDKLFLPGLRKLKRLIDSGFFGRILSVQADFGYWVFEGHIEPPQRPSWNYRKEDGGGIILDMFPHWQYVLENLFGRIRSLSAHAVTHIPERIDEHGEPYTATADDAAYATFELDGGVIVQVNSSWVTRVHREELVIFQVDGTHGSARAGLRNCVQQHRSATPRPVWNPDIENEIDFAGGWLDVPAAETYENGFKEQWADFLRHIAIDAPFPWTLSSGARGSQIVDCAFESWRERRWVDVPDLST